MRSRGALFFCLLVPALLCFVPAAAADQPAHPFTLSGVIVDVTGAAVPGADVAVGGLTTRTDAGGRFVLPVAADEVSLRVTADGFGEYSHRVRVPFVRITLHPSGVTEAVTVTAGRSPERLADTAAAVSVLTAATILTSGASMPDDALRGVPGFSLFRRSSSRVANPTTQGVSLRGLAASGASRGLVLADGIPLNDPYGAWVYWDRVPQAAIDRVEVVRGSGAESLYGLNAIGGTLQLLTVSPRVSSAKLFLEGGQHGLFRASGYVGTRRNAWEGFVAAERYALDGFPIVAPEQRGPVDENAGLRFSNALAAAGWSGSRTALGIRLNWLDEDRKNGTPLQRNDTNLWSLAVNGRAEGLGGLFTVSGYAGQTNYDQSFSAISVDRTTERLTARQRIASDNAGASLQWFRQWSGGTLLAGGEAQRVSGGGGPIDSGIQHDSALYAQLGFNPVARLTVVAAVRAGAWSATPEGATGLDRRTWYLVPRLSLTWVQSPSVSLTASWSSPARTPTLNELYRDFRVGNVYTESNGLLAPEDAQSAEVGVLVRRGRASLRLLGYWSQVDEAITNVTLRIAPDLITRQRRNAGTIRARGVEAEGEWRPAGWASIVASLAFADSRFTRSDERGLAGRRVAQVPRWRGTVSGRVTRGRAVASVDWRSTGAQFDDDQNRFELGASSVLDGYFGISLPRGLQPFVAAENIFDAEVDVGRTPVRTIGTPRSVRAGVRMSW